MPVLSNQDSLLLIVSSAKLLGLIPTAERGRAHDCIEDWKNEHQENEKYYITEWKEHHN